MARAVLNAQAITRAGLNPVATPITQADGAAIAHNNGAYVVQVVNPTGAPINVTQRTNASVAGVALPNLAPVPVPANDAIFLGPWTDYPFAQATGQVYLDVSADGLEMAVLTFTPNQ